MNGLLGRLAPAGWTDVVIRAVVTEAAGFTALVLKEWLETREWDLSTCAIDAAWVAAAVLFLNAVFLVASGRSRSA